jgi:enoyl-CoA hydratase
VIAAVNGPAYGGGFALAMALRHPHRVTVGAGHAFDLILTARTVEADEALRIGLVSRLSTASVLDEALAIAETLCGYGKFGLESTKQVLWANLEAPSLQAALQVENRSQILSSTSGELAHATAAFKTRKG